MDRDLSLDALLDLDGQVLVVDPAGRHWVKFIVRRVPASVARPHGLHYSLTLHGPDGRRLVGYDNAHAGGNADRSHDHRHRRDVVKAYAYSDAATLLADFWSDVEKVLKEDGAW